MLLGLSLILTTEVTVYANEESKYVQVISITKELEQWMEDLANQYKQYQSNVMQGLMIQPGNAGHGFIFVNLSPYKINTG